MRNRFLVFAVVTSVMACFMLPDVGFAATSASASAEISVEEETTLTLVLNGKSASSSFSLDPFAYHSAAVVEWTMPDDAIVVMDYTGSDEGNDGHMITVGLHSNTWWYDGSAGGVDLAISTNVSPGVDELTFGLWASSNTFVAGLTFADVDDGCTATGASLMSANGGPYTVEERKMFWNEEVCPGTSYYPPELFVIGPSNGLYAGTYTISGTYVVYDDSDTTL